MRRVLASLIVIGLAAVTVSMGVAPARSEDVAKTSTVAVQQVSVTEPIRDEAAMVLVGAMLIGLAAAVRRAA